jgi:hypothetical protein
MNEGIDSNVKPISAPSKSITRYLSTEIASQVDEGGLLRIPSTDRVSAAGRPIISEQLARELGETLARSIAGSVAEVIDHDRGGRIQYTALRTCGRAFYAESPLPDLPAEVPDYVRRTYGPWWLISMCDAMLTPVVSVAVSAYATNLSVADGRIKYPPIHGTEFQVAGIPTRLGALPLPPEEAIREVGERSGTTLAEMPRLIAPLPQEGMPQMSRWRLVGSQSFRVTRKSNGLGLATGDLFVRRRSFADDVGFETTSAASNLIIRWLPVPELGSIRTVPTERETVVPLPPGTLTQFEQVSFGTGAP